MKSAIMVAVVAAVVLGIGYFVFLEFNRPSIEEFRWGRARMDVHVLDLAARAYYEENKQWPPDLEALTKPMPDGKRAFIKDASQLIDPWGRRYQYDPKQLRPQNDKPLIWCVPDPGNPERKITND